MLSIPKLTDSLLDVYVIADTTQNNISSEIVLTRPYDNTMKQNINSAINVKGKFSAGQDVTASGQNTICLGANANAI